VKTKDIREKNQEELKNDLVELRGKMTKLRFDISAKQVKNNRELRKVKKDIAKILTVIKEKQVKDK
jgi:large subunit ribosomal protein L29